MPVSRVTPGQMPKCPISGQMPDLRAKCPISGPNARLQGFQAKCPFTGFPGQMPVYRGFQAKCPYSAKCPWWYGGCMPVVYMLVYARGYPPWCMHHGGPTRGHRTCYIWPHSGWPWGYNSELWQMGPFFGSQNVRNGVKFHLLGPYCSFGPGPNKTAKTRFFGVFTQNHEKIVKKPTFFDLFGPHSGP